MQLLQTVFYQTNLLAFTQKVVSGPRWFWIQGTTLDYEEHEDWSDY